MATKIKHLGTKPADVYIGLGNHVVAISRKKNEVTFSGLVVGTQDDHVELAVYDGPVRKFVWLPKLDIVEINYKLVSWTDAPEPVAV